jgi:hypothetical protein
VLPKFTNPVLLLFFAKFNISGVKMKAALGLSLAKPLATECNHLFIISAVGLGISCNNVF